MDAGGKKLFESNVELKLALATDLPQNSGAFQITVSPWDKLSKLELRVDGTLAASRSHRDAGACTPSELDRESVKLLPPATSPDDPYFLKIAWPKPYDRDMRHTVQARLPGQDWQTISVGITDATTKVFLDRGRFELPPPPARGQREHSFLEVQILRSSGFSETPIYEAKLAIEA